MNRRSLFFVSVGNGKERRNEDLFKESWWFRHEKKWEHEILGKEQEMEEEVNQKVVSVSFSAISLLFISIRRRPRMCSFGTQW